MRRGFLMVEPPFQDGLDAYKQRLLQYKARLDKSQ